MTGAVNSLILSFALSIILFAAYNKTIVKAYKQPACLKVTGGIVVIAMLYLVIKAIISLII